MAFELAPDLVYPSGTTVSSYQVSRLGQSPSMRITYTETVNSGVNDIGIAAHKPAVAGRTWEINLSTSIPEQKAVLLDMLSKVTFKLVKEAVVSLGQGNTLYTDEQIAQACLNISTVDALIATECENVEKGRRAGYLKVFPMGNAPTVP